MNASEVWSEAGPSRVPTDASYACLSDVAPGRHSPGQHSRGSGGPSGRSANGGGRCGHCHPRLNIYQRMPCPKSDSSLLPIPRHALPADLAAPDIRTDTIAMDPASRGLLGVSSRSGCCSASPRWPRHPAWAAWQSCRPPRIVEACAGHRSPRGWWAREVRPPLLCV